MNSQYTIGQLAGAVSVPTSTVRYYERCGLVEPDRRTESNYRVYGEPALERMRFILAAKAHGFTLEDIRTLLDHRDGRRDSCEHVQRLLEDRLAGLETRLAQLHEVQSVLHASLEQCRAAVPDGKCRTMESLNEEACLPVGEPGKKPT